MTKATLWVKAQHEGALPPPGIVRKDPSAQRLVWAAKQALGKAALGALFA